MRVRGGDGDGDGGDGGDEDVACDGEGEGEGEGEVEGVGGVRPTVMMCTTPPVRLPFAKSAVIFAKSCFSRREQSNGTLFIF